MHITRARTTKKHPYVMHDQQLEIVTETKYLGITISNNLSWNNHINNIVASAKQSSANNRIFDVILFVMSFIYIRNRTGPNTLPYGTPDATSTLSDMVFSTRQTIRYIHTIQQQDKQSGTYIQYNYRTNNQVHTYNTTTRQTIRYTHTIQLCT
jgi:hypothetical protein